MPDPEQIIPAFSRSREFWEHSGEHVPRELPGEAPPGPPLRGGARPPRPRGGPALAGQRRHRRGRRGRPRAGETPAPGLNYWRVFVACIYSCILGQCVTDSN